MNMKKVIAVLLSVAMYTALTGNLQAASLKKGMTRQEVIEKMGEPDRTRQESSFEIMLAVLTTRTTLPE